jgi:diguanylate cyclase (GGDEF)-like protein
LLIFLDMALFGLLKKSSSLQDITLVAKHVAELSDFLASEVYTLQGRSRLEKFLQKAFDPYSGAVYMYNRQSNQLEAVALFGLDEPELLQFHPEACSAMVSGQSSLGPLGESSCRHFGTGLASGTLCIPLKTEQDSNGLLVLTGIAKDFSLECPLYYIYKTVANVLSLYLDNMDLKLRFKKHSIRDPLTGLFNRHYMEESLAREVAAAYRRKAPIGIIMLHIDSLMEIRDVHGKDAAEQMMWEIGRRLPTYIRTEDIPCRYSKMAFAVILPTAGLQITLQRATRIKKEIEEMRVGFGAENLSSGVSVGIGILPDHADDAELLLQRTEEALFSAVYEGGDGIVQAKMP